MGKYLLMREVLKVDRLSSRQSVMIDAVTYRMTRIVEACRNSVRARPLAYGSA
jgi:hypothetical protein